MDVFEAVRTVLAVRRYTERQVSTQVQRRIVDAGRLSASSINLQPWHFIVVQERETLRKLGDIMTTGHYIAGASFAVVVVVEKDSASGVSDGSRAIQNMILTAWADGVGSNWVGFGPLPEVERLLGVPKSFEGLAVVPFGYPATTLGRGTKKRKPLREIASNERFGEPLTRR